MRTRMPIIALVLLTMSGSSLFRNPRVVGCALPNCDIDWQFYSDDTFSTQVGGVPSRFVFETPTIELCSHYSAFL